jgi:RsiW-degrading membrane proteinase PrsW (M82 family)
MLEAPADENEAARAVVAPRRGLRYDLLAVTVAVIGGVLGIGGAAIQELTSGGGILLLVVGAPVIEEALKPAGLYILLIRWPHALHGRTHIALLAALSGLTFGIIESFVYVTLYFPEGGSDFVPYRFSVTPALHASASFLVGLGLTRAIIDWAMGRGSLPKSTRTFYIAGVLLHAVYNLAAVILEVAGVLEFQD